MGVALSDQLKWPTSFSDLSVYNVGCPPWTRGTIWVDEADKETKNGRTPLSPKHFDNNLEIRRNEGNNITEFDYLGGGYYTFQLVLNYFLKLNPSLLE